MRPCQGSSVNRWHLRIWWRACARERRARITVALESTGTAHPGTPYPARSDTLTAGDWNKAAAANNRVEFSVETSTPQ